jgi:hypothetical protein
MQVPAAACLLLLPLPLLLLPLPLLLLLPGAYQGTHLAAAAEFPPEDRLLHRPV